jgi:hypothetical protein
MIVRKTSDFEPAPEGQWRAVCVDVVDLGKQETPWGVKPKLRIVWELEETLADGRRYTVSKKYTASLNERSNLHKDLRMWRGRPFTAEELAGFDLEKVVGAACQVLVTHTEREGTVYANVVAVVRPQGTPLKPSGKYIRVKDRQDNGMPAKFRDALDSGPPEPEEEMIPF